MLGIFDIYQGANVDLPVGHRSFCQDETRWISHISIENLAPVHRNRG